MIWCAAHTPLFSQCAVSGGPGPFSFVELRAHLMGLSGDGGARITLFGSCPGDTNARVRFRLDTTRPLGGLIVSPSEGITPAEVQFGVDPKLYGEDFPRTASQAVFFTTVDQTPTARLSVNIRTTFVTATGPPTISSVVNAASLAPSIAPGAVVLIRGTSLASRSSHTLDATGTYPTTLGRTTVTFNGIPAPLLETGPIAIQAVVPYGLAGTSAAQVVVTQFADSAAQRVSAAFSVPVAESSLGIFNRAQCPICPHPIQNCDENGCTTNTSDNPAAKGSIITLFATGLPPPPGPQSDGAVTILPRLNLGTSITIGGKPAQLLYAGPEPYQVRGVIQINARIPENIASGAQPIVLTVDQISTAPQQVSVAVR